MIKWEFNIDKQEEADHAEAIEWNLAAMLIEAEEAAENIWRGLVTDRAHLGEECMGDDVKQEAE